MSDTEQRQRVKPGDVVRLKAFPTVDMRVFAVTEDGIIGYWADESAPELRRRRWADIIEPEPPKAKPGVRYRRASSRFNDWDWAIGKANGDLFVYHFAAGSPMTSVDFDATWQSD